LRKSILGMIGKWSIKILTMNEFFLRHFFRILILRNKTL